MGVGPRELLTQKTVIGPAWRGWSSSGIQVECSQAHEGCCTDAPCSSCTFISRACQLSHGSLLRGLFWLDTMLSQVLFLRTLISLPLFSQATVLTTSIQVIFPLCRHLIACLFIYGCHNWVDSSYWLSLNS